MQQEVGSWKQEVYILKKYIFSKGTNMSGVSFFGNIPWFFFAVGGITGCGSASLKLYFCDAVYHWGQSPSPGSQ